MIKSHTERAREILRAGMEPAAYEVGERVDVGVGVTVDTVLRRIPGAEDETTIPLYDEPTVVGHIAALLAREAALREALDESCQSLLRNTTAIFQHASDARRYMEDPDAAWLCLRFNSQDHVKRARDALGLIQQRWGEAQAGSAW